MSDNATPVELLLQNAEDYGKTTLELVKLQAVATYADVASTLVMRLIIIAVVALCTLMVSVGFALWIGMLVGAVYGGFFIVGLFYAVVILLLYIFKYQWLKTPVSNNIILQLLK
jgi:phosphoglycerol transferase MdoB-like AlkP superfamily enzyme